jgi:hypothetical protein
MRRLALSFTVGWCLLASAPTLVLAAEGGAVSPAAASESAHIKPAAERKLAAERPTIKKKAQQKAQASTGVGRRA